MNKTTCEMINDLLPLYTDNVCSEDSRVIVAEHIASCDKCRGQLEKMSRHLDVDPENDIAVIKRIKHRIAVERFAITSAIVLFVVIVGYIAGFVIFNTDCSICYHDVKDCISVEERSNGDLWMKRTDLAASNTWYVMPNVYDSQWRSLMDEGFDKLDPTYFSYTLRQRISDRYFSHTIFAQEEYSYLFNIHEKENIDAVYYYDDINNEKHMLWERS